MGNKNKRKANPKESGASTRARLMPNVFEEACLNDFIRTKTFKTLYRKHEDCETKDCIIVNKPFKCCTITNFIKSQAFLEGLKEELLALPFIEKNNDLYKFRQSTDLMNVTSPYIASIKKCLYEDFKNVIEDICDVKINEHVDVTASCYEQTDVLLCHDDRLEGRVVAFILYLVPQWKECDGGRLDMFETNEYYQPCDVKKSFIPTWNQLVFFEVSHNSFHQVSEVLARDKLRLSISGWLHGSKETSKVIPLCLEDPPLLTCPKEFQEEDFYSWINPNYIDPKVQKEIKEKFEESSEIQLECFIQPTLYDEVCKALKDSSLKWNRKGPANKRNYEVIDENDCPKIVKDCLSFLTSEALFLILSQLTGLSLHKKDACHSQNKDPCSSSAIRQWKHGCYTLVYDDAPKLCDYILDGIMYFNCDSWDVKMGGLTSYISEGEDEELLSVLPKCNSLCLIYRDKMTVGFVKYINCLALEVDPEFRYQDISLSYYESDEK